MNRMKRLCLIGLLLGILSLIPPRGWPQSKPDTKGPVVISAYALEKRWDGSIWIILIEAEAGAEEMSKIGVGVDQVGYGRHPTEWILLKPHDNKYLKGYLQWNIHNVSNEFQVTLKLFIVDRAGNESKEVVFPLVIESGSGIDHSRPVAMLDPSDLPPPFDRGDIPRLGYIMIDLAGSTPAE